MQASNSAFSYPLSLPCNHLFSRAPPSHRLCKRRRPKSPAPGEDHSDSSNSQHLLRCRKERIKEDSKWDHSDLLREHAKLSDLPTLSPTPAEKTGHLGFREEGREEDEAYWRQLRAREVAFRLGTLVTEEDLKPPDIPLDRHGNPARYPAAVRYDDETEEWVPTTEEEEERLKNPYPIKDPFFVREAEEGERYTTLRWKRKGGSEKEEEGEEEKEVFMYGGLEFEHNVVVKDMSHHRRKRLNMKNGAWKVVHLGTSSAIPTAKRNVSSTAVLMKPRTTDGEPDMFLVDAGENTDDQLIQCDWCMTHGFRWIRAIFITHLHGDHIYGLPMLLANIGKYAQHRRRKAIENGYDGSDPVIRIFGPYGTRGFVRASLYWTNPVGVRFSIAELVPRNKDFRHVRVSYGESMSPSEIFVHECGSDEVIVGVGLDLATESPPPHPEEEQAENIHVSDDGLWHVWEQEDGVVKTEVVAAPLRHRLPCFGYVFRESKMAHNKTIDVARMNSGSSEGNGVANHFGNGTLTYKNGIDEIYEIDKLKAKELGVHGTQLRVLRSGRSITVSKTGVVVRPEDVATNRLDSKSNGNGSNDHEPMHYKKVTVLGDTSDSSAIAEAAMDSDLLIHEATFTESLKAKAKLAMHSTASMAGAFGRHIRARKIALTHFSSRYEMFHSDADYSQSQPEGTPGEPDEDYFEGMLSNGDEDFANPNQLVREALEGYGDKNANIIAAYDFLGHDINPVSDLDLDATSSTFVEPSAVRGTSD